MLLAHVLFLLALANLIYLFSLLTSILKRMHSPVLYQFILYKCKKSNQYFPISAHALFPNGSGVPLNTSHTKKTELWSHGHCSGLGYNINCQLVHFL